MKKVWIGLGLLLVVVAVVLAQLPSRDSISRVGTAPNQQYNTYVVDAGKAIAYAKQVMRGSPTDASGESVDSALNRIDYRLDNLTIDWNDVTGKPLLGGGQAIQSLSADRVTWQDDAGGIFGTGTLNVDQALTYLDDVAINQWHGVLPWGRVSNKPTTWAWSNISGRPSVWPGTLGAQSVTWSSDAGGIFGLGTRNVADALSYLDDYGPASRWPTWSDVRTQSGTGLQGSDVSLNTANFNGLLGSVHNNVQFMADAIDDVATARPWTTTASVTTTSDGYGEDLDEVGIVNRAAYQVGKAVFINGQVDMDGDYFRMYATIPLPYGSSSGRSEIATAHKYFVGLDKIWAYTNGSNLYIYVHKNSSVRHVGTQNVTVHFSGFYIVQ